MKREQGYYWIKYRDTWCIGYYFHNCQEFMREGNLDKYWEWQSRLWHDEDVDEDELQEIIETRILSPDEKDKDNITLVMRMLIDKGIKFSYDPSNNALTYFQDSKPTEITATAAFTFDNDN